MPEETSPKQGGTKKDRPHLLSYLVVLFSAAFLLLLLSYFMEQRHQQEIDGLQQQQNMSAMQTTQNVIERNQVLLDENEALRQHNEKLKEQAKQAVELQELQKKNTLALDYLWRIEREYFQGRHAAARTLIQEFEQAGLDAHLPEEPISDPDYRSPMEQYKSIYNILF